MFMSDSEQKIQHVGIKDDPEEMSISGTSPSISALASEVKRLHEASLRAMDKRARLPQPLFWSLFHSQVRSIKQRKDRDRLVRSILDNL